MSKTDEDELKIKAIQPDEAPEPDAEGHSMQIYDLARTMHTDRMRNAAEAAKQPRMRDQPKKDGRGFLRRR